MSEPDDYFQGFKANESHPRMASTGTEGRCGLCGKIESPLHDAWEANKLPPPGPAHGASEADHEYILAGFRLHGFDEFRARVDSAIAAAVASALAMPREAIDKAHELLDALSFLSKRSVGHDGLVDRVIKLIDQHASAVAELEQKNDLLKIAGEFLAIAISNRDKQAVLLATALRERDEALHDNRRLTQRCLGYEEVIRNLKADLTATKAAMAETRQYLTDQDVRASQAETQLAEANKDRDRLQSVDEKFGEAVSNYESLLAAKQHECEELAKASVDGLEAAGQVLIDYKAQLTAEQQAHENTKAELKETSDVAKTLDNLYVTETKQTVELEAALEEMTKLRKSALQQWRAISDAFVAAEQARAEEVKLAKINLRNAWEAGFQLCRHYGDNHAHFRGLQKEGCWQTFLNDIERAARAGATPKQTQTQNEVRSWTQPHADARVWENGTP